MIVDRRLRLCLMLAGSLVALPSVAQAQDDIRLAADVAANIGYSNNPFSQIGGDTGSGVADILITPSATMINERSVFVLSGSAEYQQYFRNYSNSQNYSARLDYRGTPSERLKTHLNLSYVNAVIGNDNSVNGPFDPTRPPDPVTGTDLSLFGSRDRRETLRADGDLSYVLSARDTITAGAFIDRTRFKRFGLLGDYDGYSASAGYSRQISERLQVGLRGSAATYNYTGAQSDSTIYTIQPSFTAKINARWTADGSFGASFVDNQSRGSSTSLSGNINLCRVGERTNFCITGDRSVQPTGILGTQTATSIGANYSYRISERGTIFADANYVRNGGGQFLVIGQNELVRASVGYERQLKERLRLTATARYRDIFGGGINRAADYGAQIGLTMKFGNNK